MFLVDLQQPPRRPERDLSRRTRQRRRFHVNPRDGSRLRLHETELLDAIPHLVAIDSQKLTCMCLVALRALERLDQQLPLDLFEVDTTDGQLKLLRAACSPHQAREVARFEPV